MLDNQDVVWTTCSFPNRNAADQGRTAVSDLITPRWEKRPLTTATLPSLLTDLDDLRQTVAITRAVPPPPPPQPGEAVSRRDLLQGRLWSDIAPEPAREPRTETITREQPIAGSLRYALARLLLQTVARYRRCSVAAAMQRAFELPPLNTDPIPLQLDLSGGYYKTAVSVLLPHVISLGYTTPPGDPKATLGNNGERLQKYVRQLKKWLLALPETDFQPAIHLHLKGALGALYENGVGRVLGTLYGIEKAADPLPVWVTDPLHLADPEEHVTALAQLKEYMGIRQLKTKLVAEAHLRRVSDVRAMLEGEATDQILIDLTVWGSLPQAVSALRHCRQQDVGVLLRGARGEGETAVRTTTQIALALRPTLLLPPPYPQKYHQIRDEMARSLLG